MRRPFPTLSALAGFGLLLSGCASQSWVKPGGDEAQMRADYRECVRLAQPAVERDARIESDIMSTRGDDYRRSGSMMTRRGIADARTSGRQDDEIYSCMRSRGYMTADQAPPAK
ncbi:hypothetical protein STAQ_03060 [Allostella sp. ATCC 35155]|nr:hypothetical protein STAQ_03060 [Stella sp. ATCC 35155]